MDIPYTYFNGPSPSVLNDTVATTLQQYITRFAETGNPNSPRAPYFPVYGSNATVQDLNISSITQVRDPAAK